MVFATLQIIRNGKLKIQQIKFEILAYQKQNQLGSNVYRKHGDYKIC